VYFTEIELRGKLALFGPPSLALESPPVNSRLSTTGMNSLQKRSVIVIDGDNEHGAIADGRTSNSGFLYQRK
jgi:hypothetical protein